MIDTAAIRPFKGIRFSSESGDVTSRIAPPYDVVDQDAYDALVLCDSHNAARLETAGSLVDSLADIARDASSPIDATAIASDDTTSPDINDDASRYTAMRARWDSWLDDGTLAADAEPAIYLLRQRFSYKGRIHDRVSFIVEMRLYGFDEGVVLPHERTLEPARRDRYRLLEATRVNTSPVFGLYEDASDAYFSLVDEVMSQKPVSYASDATGSCTLWAIRDAGTIAYLVRTLDDSQVFIADGHHRYTVACAYRDAQRALEGDSGYREDRGSDQVMIALSNMCDPQLLVRGYHRGVSAPPGFSQDVFLGQAAQYFDITVDADRDDLSASTRPAFLALFGNRSRFLFQLKEGIDIDRAVPGNASDALKHLDVTVLQSLVLGPLLDCDPDAPDAHGRIAYSPDVEQLLSQLDEGKLDIVFIMRPTPLRALANIARAGELLPQKSTYFYPKLPTGLVFRAMC